MLRINHPINDRTETADALSNLSQNSSNHKSVHNKTKKTQLQNQNAAGAVRLQYALSSSSRAM